jgi:hypothetical protein
MLIAKDRFFFFERLEQRIVLAHVWVYEFKENPSRTQVNKDH